ncbi:unnamed protein product [Symbiodinium necroappetens]|uniref:Uncharacterized protein n=1 Tax=Symbiodinium necroappetens TaxID=1628268 RepID=A0A813AVT0_9DINO|nr:unnamed protein product [Symbiodinium sp. KB8]CAE7882265.1 unnamed protein product [Symbiodinium necroappetens]
MPVTQLCWPGPMHACKVTATSRLPPWRQSSRRTLFLCSSGSSDSVIQTKVRVNGTPRSAGGGLRRC